MQVVLTTFLTPLEPKDWIQLAVLFAVLYAVLRFLRRTIAGGLFRGAALLTWVAIVGLFLALKWLELDVVNAVFRRAFPILLIGLAVMFQHELRHGIARLGRRSVLARVEDMDLADVKEINADVEAILKAVFDFARRRIGALVAIERNVALTTYIDTGVPMDARLRSETLDTIFITDTVLHDGAVIVCGNRIAAAGCLLPLTEKPELKRSYGTRHRAAIGLSEQSDALIIVVSEERGQVHVVEHGKMTPHADPKFLRAVLNVVFAEHHGYVERAPARASA